MLHTSCLVNVINDSSLKLTVAGLHCAHVGHGISAKLNGGTVRVIAYLSPRHFAYTACLRTLGEFRPVCGCYLATVYILPPRIYIDT